MLNRIILMGRLTRDPELRRTQSGTPVASFTLAVDRDFADKATGNRPTDFIDIVAWRGTAEFVSKYFSKGRMAVVEGRLQIRDWQDREGNKRRSAEVVADNIYFGDSRRDSDGGSYGNRSNSSYGGSYGSSNNSYAPAAPQSNSYSAPAAPAVSEFAELSDDDGELPF
ncbi:MAG: single-stranded DNA-binding protein [Clostridiales bacterium]|nr:single-stranded DNA-binding protein [Clostridiales bacterium]